MVVVRVVCDRPRVVLASVKGIVLKYLHDPNNISGNILSMDTEIITRKQYLAASYQDPSLHQRYYGQFASDDVINYVIGAIGADRIMRSTESAMNDIPLRLWDGLMPPVDWALWQQATGSLSHSLSDIVCISKAAARKWKERQ